MSNSRDDEATHDTLRADSPQAISEQPIVFGGSGTLPLDDVTTVAVRARSTSAPAYERYALVKLLGEGEHQAGGRCVERLGRAIPS